MNFTARTRRINNVLAKAVSCLGIPLILLHFTYTRFPNRPRPSNLYPPTPAVSIHVFSLSLCITYIHSPTHNLCSWKCVRVLNHWDTSSPHPSESKVLNLAGWSWPHPIKEEPHPGKDFGIRIYRVSLQSVTL